MSVQLPFVSLGGVSVRSVCLSAGLSLIDLTAGNFVSDSL